MKAMKAKAMKALKYATVFRFGASWSICTWHYSKRKAKLAAKQCEHAGGSHHEIWEVTRHRKEERKA
jgi:hypothetical protein